ncbi:Gibberellin-regulated protein 6 [Camellia lanceoleosa]|uniref:Gibberellin-regulated protein 6 n=1 Tax=Camellia lanceoleosa TaxID=1840588 RepID=A0ACC0G9L2_9ERIC|nr:Gibberellin-regulated protein 6 [Camellia lanceoleosa]
MAKFASLLLLALLAISMVATIARKADATAAFGLNIYSGNTERDAMHFQDIASAAQYHLSRQLSGQGSLKSYQCPSQCQRRCSQTQYKKPCLFFCNKCCSKCLCVPPGYYGNKGMCPLLQQLEDQERKPQVCVCDILGHLKRWDCTSKIVVRQVQIKKLSKVCNGIWNWSAELHLESSILDNTVRLPTESGLSWCSWKVCHYGEKRFLLKSIMVIKRPSRIEKGKGIGIESDSNHDNSQYLLQDDMVSFLDPFEIAFINNTLDDDFRFDWEKVEQTFQNRDFATMDEDIGMNGNAFSKFPSRFLSDFPIKCGTRVDSSKKGSIRKHTFV